MSKATLLQGDCMELTFCRSIFPDGTQSLYTSLSSEPLRPLITPWKFQDGISPDFIPASRSVINSPSSTTIMLCPYQVAFVHLLTVKNRCRSVFYQCHAGTSLHVVRCSENAFDFGFRFLLNLFHVWPCRHFACAMFQVPCIMSVCLNGHFYG